MAIFELGWPSQKKTGTAQEPPNAAWPQVISSPSSLSAANAPLEPVTNHHLGILNSVTSNWEEFSQNKKWYPLIAFPNSVNPFFRGKPTERKTQQLRCKRPLICPERHLVSAQRNGVGIVLADCLLLMPSQAMQVKRPSHHSQVAHQLVPWMENLSITSLSSNHWCWIFQISILPSLGTSNQFKAVRPCCPTWQHFHHLELQQRLVTRRQSRELLEADLALNLSGRSLVLCPPTLKVLGVVMNSRIAGVSTSQIASNIALAGGHLCLGALGFWWFLFGKCSTKLSIKSGLCNLSRLKGPVNAFSVSKSNLHVN